MGFPYRVLWFLVWFSTLLIVVCAPMLIALITMFLLGLHNYGFIEADIVVVIQLIYLVLMRKRIEWLMEKTIDVIEGGGLCGAST